MIRLQCEQLSIASPCEGWDIRALLNHAFGAAWMYTLAYQGVITGAEAGDLVADNPQRALEQVAEVNIASWKEPRSLYGERTFPFGTFLATTALWLNVAEIAVHSWDLATATGQDPGLDPEVVAALMASFRTLGATQLVAINCHPDRLSVTPA
jgi:uncharacterized protein (TIGR03086 family)